MLIKVCLLWWEPFSSIPDRAALWTCCRNTRGLSALKFLEKFQSTSPCYQFKMSPRILDLKAMQTVNLQVQTWGKCLSMPREQGSHQQCLGTVPTGLLPDVSKKVKWAGGRAWCAVSAPEPAIFRAAQTHWRAAQAPRLLLSWEKDLCCSTSGTRQSSAFCSSKIVLRASHMALCKQSSSTGLRNGQPRLQKLCVHFNL